MTVWFQKASTILDEYQRFNRLQEEKKHQEKRQMYLDQQKEVLDKLRVSASLHLDSEDLASLQGQLYFILSTRGAWVY